MSFITVDGNKVTVVIGKDAHPMIEKHYIEWVYLQTQKAVSANPFAERPTGCGVYADG